MTGLEQGLRYIEREIRFMVKDQFGNPTYTKYADRVIEDACGIPNFCTTVLASKRPLTAILKAVRGPRGDVIVRFFNSALHDTRIEMVMVLSEVAKLRNHNNRNSKNAHIYFMKLYRKANKRMVRLITGSKNKESFKSMYRGLRDFAKMDDFDYDEDDEDEIDSYFDDVGEFGDSDYAEACLNAYRDGKTPPESEMRTHTVGGIDTTLKGNEEILREIASIEAKLGRHLTDAELDKLLCDDDDDDEINPFAGLTKDRSNDMIDSIVDILYKRLVDKIGGNLAPVVETPKYETLDEFIDREDSNDRYVDVSTPKSIPQNASTEELIEIHNRLKNDVPVAEATSATDSSNDSDDESDSDDTNCLPPNDKLGGAFREADFIDVGSADDYSNQSIDDNSDQTIENDEASVYESTSNGLIASSKECSDDMQNGLLVNDCINDCNMADSEITNAFINRIQNYFVRIGIKVNDIFVSLVPSNGDDKLLTLLATVRISGDYEIVNMMHLNTVALMHIKNIAERFGISENMIDSEFNVVDSNNTFDSDLKVLNTVNKNFTSKTLDNLYSMMSAISVYIYRRLNKLVDVRFVNNPNSNCIDVYFFSKTDESLGSDFEEFYRTELTADGVLNEIKNRFNINHVINYHIINDEEEFFEQAKRVINNIIHEIPLLDKYINANEKTIKCLLSNYGIETKEVLHSVDISTGRKNVIVDMIYRVFTKSVVDRSQVDELATQYDINGEYLVQPENVIRAITMNSQISVYIEYHEFNDDEDESENENAKTSNFGI